MSNHAAPESGTLFPTGYRASGVLLHLTSLPGPYGVGDAGPPAYQWVDALVEAGQSWWQLLPLGPTDYGNSPYQSSSTFAGNVMLVSPEKLIEEGLLARGDLGEVNFPSDRVDYEAIKPFKNRLLDRALANFLSHPGGLSAAFDAFCQQQGHWLEDYALFMALRETHDRKAWFDWPAELMRREPSAMQQARGALADKLQKYRFRQFIAYRQWTQLKEYAHGKGLRLIGDLPIFVSLDSADVWANPDQFLLDEQHRPTVLAGVPPDYFSPVGQLWGNPLYDWQKMQRDGYRWWMARLRASLEHVDVIRLDHFRGFDAAWHVPAKAPTAQEGQWVEAPGEDFLTHVRQELGGLPLIAEDLGLITPTVRALRDRFHLPGMRILQFAFDGLPENPYLPERYTHNTVVYTGTHDNNTTRGWFQTLPDYQFENLSKLLGHWPTAEGVTWDLIRVAMESIAALAVIPLQDLLNLDSSARMNMPGVAEGNWEWRFTEEMHVNEALARLLEVTLGTNRQRV
jgi:4-alpha-glucanotransferase